jgi:hypothetical protein
MPLPERGGRLDQLRRLIPVTDEGWALLRGWLVASLFPNIDHPILRLVGAKSTATAAALHMISSLIDPSRLQIRSKPTSRENWLAFAEGSWCLAIQNITHIPDWFGEILNQSITGRGRARRSLRSDGDMSISQSRHVIAMSGLPTGPIPEDLVEGFVVVELTTPDAASHLPEAYCLNKFEELKPQLLGALLDEVSATLHRLPNVKLAGDPRMADFAKILAALPNFRVALAIASGLPTEEQEQASGNAVGCSIGPAPGEVLSLLSADECGQVADKCDARISTQDKTDKLDRSFVEVYLRQLEHLAFEDVECDPVATAIAAIVQGRGDWQGTAADLLTALDRPKAARGWPQTSPAMGLRLVRLTPGLQTMGITVAYERLNDRNRTRMITLTADRSIRPQPA